MGKRPGLPLLLRRFVSAAAYVGRSVFQTASSRTDDDSWVVYAAFMLLFLADFSLLALAFPLSLWAYSGLLTRKPRRYWQVGGKGRKGEGRGRGQESTGRRSQECPGVVFAVCACI